MFKFKAQVPVVVLEGLITNKVSDEFKERLYRASLLAEAYIFQIDSPGGLVVPSKEIADSIKKINKPTVAQIRGTGASGAYWIASACKTIVASDMSMVGSIGVRAGYLQFNEFFEKLGIRYQNLNSGAFKGSGNPFEELTGEQKNYLEELSAEAHEYFITAVAQNRNLPAKEIRKIANGKIFHGYKAKDLGLVDHLGDLSTAMDLCKKQLGKDIYIKIYRPKVSLLDMLGK